MLRQEIHYLSLGRQTPITLVGGGCWRGSWRCREDAPEGAGEAGEAADSGGSGGQAAAGGGGATAAGGGREAGQSPGPPSSRLVYSANCDSG